MPYGLPVYALSRSHLGDHASHGIAVMGREGSPLVQIHGELDIPAFRTALRVTTAKALHVLLQAQLQHMTEQGIALDCVAERKRDAVHFQFSMPLASDRTYALQAIEQHRAWLTPFLELPTSHKLFGVALISAARVLASDDDQADQAFFEEIMPLVTRTLGHHSTYGVTADARRDMVGTLATAVGLNPRVCIESSRRAGQTASPPVPQTIDGRRTAMWWRVHSDASWIVDGLVQERVTHSDAEKVREVLFNRFSSEALQDRASRELVETAPVHVRDAVSIPAASPPPDDTLLLTLMQAVSFPPEGQSTNEKGLALESLAKQLFLTEPSFKVRYERMRGRSFELDLVVECTNVDKVPLMRETGRYLVVECKNEQSRTSAAQVRDFAQKLADCRVNLGVIVTREGITGKDRKDARDVVANTFIKHGRFIITLTLSDVNAIVRRECSLIDHLDEHASRIRFQDPVIGGHDRSRRSAR